MPQGFTPLRRTRRGSVAFWPKAGQPLSVNRLQKHHRTLFLPSRRHLGVVMNGTSSVLYGTVPELASPGHEARAFALFYTGTIGSGAISPVLFGVIGDFAGPSWGAVAAASAALVTCPLAVMLSPRLRTR